MTTEDRPEMATTLNLALEFPDSQTRQTFEIAFRAWLPTFEQSLASNDDMRGYVYDGPSILDDPLAPDVPGMPGQPPYKHIRIGWPGL
jgi:hypothetical protein